MAFKTTESNARFLPYDEAVVWRGIYERLQQSIGAPQAYSWFGHCKFVRLQSDTLEISHWTRFGARECVRQHGADLCKAAKVSTLRVYRTGGFVPVWVTTPVTARGGYETFTLRIAA